jgi:signal transduction histidine kinase
LTTLRLYLDMLTAGMVKDEAKQGEYLKTLHTEAERLHRLIANVLDYARLENHRPRIEKGPVVPAVLLEQTRGAWAERCRESGKAVVLDDRTPPGTTALTDPALVLQILGNLVDNACKYSREAPDARLWLRAEALPGGGLALEVEDRGPGVPVAERRAVFRPFQRGRGADVTAGGVGLGLALAHRWAWLLGGRLTLRTTEVGACFRVELPEEPGGK